MQVTFKRQIEILRLLRSEINTVGLTINARKNTTPEEVDKALNEAATSVQCLNMGYANTKRAIELVEKLIERLDKIGDDSPIKEEATNYIISLKGK